MLATTLPLMALHRTEQELTKTKAIVEKEALATEEVSTDPPQESERPKVQLRKSQDTVEPRVVSVLATDTTEQPVIQQSNAESEQQLNEQDKTPRTPRSPTRRQLILATQPPLAPLPELKLPFGTPTLAQRHISLTRNNS